MTVPPQVALAASRSPVAGSQSQNICPMEKCQR